MGDTSELENNGNIKNKTPELYFAKKEIEIIQNLATFEASIVKKEMKKLKNYLIFVSRHEKITLNEDNFDRIWKGLYTCFWMSDKPINQENLAESICEIFCDFEDIKKSIEFFGSFLKIMNDGKGYGWFGLDAYRTDKFLMLTRRVFRTMFKILYKNKWKIESIKLFNNEIFNKVFKKNKAIGFTMHITDIFLEELAKISRGDITGKVVAKFLQPFINYIAIESDPKMLKHICIHIFYELLWQSELGRDYNEKFEAWRQMGFPGKSIEDLEKVEDENENEDEMLEENKELDPRAGKQDVYIPVLPVDATMVVEKFENIQYKEITNTKSRLYIKNIIKKYKKFEEGEFPFGIKKIPKPNLMPKEKIVKEKSLDLQKFKNELYDVTRKLKKLNKKARKRLLNSIDFSSVEDAEEYENILKMKLLCNNNKQMNGKIGKKSSPLVQLKTKNKKCGKENHLAISNKKNKKKEIPLVEHDVVNGNENISNIVNEPAEKNIKKKKVNSNKISRKREYSMNFKEVENEESESNSTHQSEEIEFCLPSKEIEEPILNMPLEDTKLCIPLKEEKLEFNMLLNDKETENCITPTSEWDIPLKNGEVEYYIPSKKKIKEEANKKLFEQSKGDIDADELNINDNDVIKVTTHFPRPSVRTGEKRIKIVLNHNTVQDAKSYMTQVKKVPLPYDENKKPKKGILKPFWSPGPINPFYKKKLKLNKSF